jgi:hypothetical protein
MLVLVMGATGEMLPVLQWLERGRRRTAKAPTDAGVGEGDPVINFVASVWAKIPCFRAISTELFQAWRDSDFAKQTRRYGTARAFSKHLNRVRGYLETLMGGKVAVLDGVGYMGRERAFTFERPETEEGKSEETPVV